MLSELYVAHCYDANAQMHATHLQLLSTGFCSFSQIVMADTQATYSAAMTQQLQDMEVEEIQAMYVE